MPALSDADLLALDRYLDDDETVQWAAQPKRQIAVGKASEFGFSLLWTAFAVFWTFTASVIGGTVGAQAGPPFSFFGLFGIPFILVGLFMLTKPFWRARLAARTMYVVTNRRAVVAYPESGGMTVKTVPLRLFQTMELTRRPDGSGTIRLEAAAPAPTTFGRYTPPFDFENVPDVDDAVTHLRALLVREGAHLDDGTSAVASGERWPSDDSREPAPWTPLETLDLGGGNDVGGTRADATGREDGVEDSARANLRRRTGA